MGYSFFRFFEQLLVWVPLFALNYVFGSYIWPAQYLLHSSAGYTRPPPPPERIGHDSLKVKMIVLRNAPVRGRSKTRHSFLNEKLSDRSDPPPPLSERERWSEVSICGKRCRFFHRQENLSENTVYPLPPSESFSFKKECRVLLRPLK